MVNDASTWFSTQNQLENMWSIGIERATRLENDNIRGHSKLPKRHMFALEPVHMELVAEDAFPRPKSSPPLENRTWFSPYLLVSWTMRVRSIWTPRWLTNSIHMVHWTAGISQNRITISFWCISLFCWSFSWFKFEFSFSLINFLGYSWLYGYTPILSP